MPHCLFSNYFFSDLYTSLSTITNSTTLVGMDEVRNSLIDLRPNFKACYKNNALDMVRFLNILNHKCDKVEVSKYIAPAKFSSIKTSFIDPTINGYGEGKSKFETINDFCQLTNTVYALRMLLSNCNCDSVTNTLPDTAKAFLCKINNVIHSLENALIANIFVKEQCSLNNRITQVYPF